jgi:transposase
VEVVLRCGRRIIVEGGIEMEAVLKLARGLEALK